MHVHINSCVNIPKIIEKIPASTLKKIIFANLKQKARLPRARGPATAKGSVCLYVCLCVCMCAHELCSYVCFVFVCVGWKKDRKIEGYCIWEEGDGQRKVRQ